MFPTITSPVCTPMRMRTGGLPSWLLASLSDFSATQTASAARHARSAWSCWVSGAPQNAMTLSPMYLSTVPPSASTHFATSVKWSLRKPAISAAGRVSERPVKPAMSVNRTVTLRSTEARSCVSLYPISRLTSDFGT